MDILGQAVHVVVDRPMGHRHKNMIYPINYGYIPGTIAGDGEEQDAYIMGVSEPVASFDGQVIGVVQRRNDCEDKWVVAPKGMCFHQGQIAEAVQFQEQYFDISIRSLYARSCGVIPYRKSGSEAEYLLLFQRASQSWSFPKGHMEAGETEEVTALRELQEEAGLQATLVPNASTTISYTLSGIRRQVVLFLGQVQGVPVLQPEEIEEHRWVSREELCRYLHADTAAAVERLISESDSTMKKQ